MEITPPTQPTATAMMRIAHVKFDHVLPPHIRAAITASSESLQDVGGVDAVVGMWVRFSQNGEPYAVSVRASGCELGLYIPEGGSTSGFQPGPFMTFPPEVVAYLSHAAEEALAIVQPIVALH